MLDVGEHLFAILVVPHRAAAVQAHRVRLETRPSPWGTCRTWPSPLLSSTSDFHLSGSIVDDDVVRMGQGVRGDDAQALAALGPTPDSLVLGDDARIAAI